MPATIKHHESPHDWCHLCGERSDATADLWWAENAEHDRGPVNAREAAYRGRYLRVCFDCGARICGEADPTWTAWIDWNDQRRIAGQRALEEASMAESDDAIGRSLTLDERDEYEQAVALVEDLANALSGTLNFCGPNIYDRDEYRRAKGLALGRATVALEKARRWAR